MARGYMGKLLDVDLSTGKVRVERLPQALCRQFLGGYGLGAKLLYDRMKPGTDALGPENLLGFFTGPLTGSPAIEGNRFMVVCKSPLTGTWGDANCGGTFGPALKFAGYDGILFRGIAERPVYLAIQDGKPELRDAGGGASAGDGGGGGERETCLTPPSLGRSAALERTLDTSTHTSSFAR